MYWAYNPGESEIAPGATRTGVISGGLQQARLCTRHVNATVQMRMTIDSEADVQYRVADLTVDTGTCRVLDGGKEIPVQKLSFDLFVALLRRAPRVLTTAELMDAVWGDVVVAEETVTQRVKLLRDALGPDRRGIVRTVRGRGFRIDAPVDRVDGADVAGEPPRPSGGEGRRQYAARRRSYVLAVAAVVGLSVALYIYSVTEDDINATDAATTRTVGPSERTIAVVPFLNSSGNPENEYLSDGITETLLHVLTKTDDLQVTARTSAFAFKNENVDVRTIGERLGVQTILEGSVQKVGDRLRITARLIDAGSGSYLWSENYDRSVSDIFSVQDDIGNSVVAALTTTLANDTTVVPTYEETQNAAAYNAYLQGRYFFERRSEANFRRAITYFEQALAIEPGFAAAHAALARTHIRMAAVGYVPDEEGYESGRVSTESALALDPNLADAHIAVGERKTLGEWDWAAADAAYQQALSISPHNTDAAIGAARIAGAFGRFEDSIRFLEDALARDPLAFDARHLLGHFYFYTGRNIEAAETLKKAIELYPGITGSRLVLGEVYLADSQPEAALEVMREETGAPWRRAGLAYAYNALGDVEQARAALEELIEHDREISAFQIATAYAYGGDLESAVEWLQVAFEQRDSAMLQLYGAPGLAQLHDDPRFRGILRRLKVIE